MKIIYALIFCFSFVSIGFSQIEKPTKTIKFGVVKQKNAPVTPVNDAKTPAEIRYESTLPKNTDEKLLKDFSLLPKKEEKSIFENEDIHRPSEIYTEKYNKQLKTEGLTKDIVNSDLFLGEFIVFDKELDISCRDYSAIDGDVVRLWLNNEIVIKQVDLESGYKKYHFELKEGLNIIHIEALNIGESFPNTGEFKFIDSKGKLVTHQTWGLNTGYKAIVKIYKMKGMEQSEKK